MTRAVDWKRCFGLYVWFGMPANAPIRECLQAYDTAWNSGYAAKPFAMYCERLGENKAFHFDILYHLLQLKCSDVYSMKTTLDPRCSTAFSLDYRITWHIAIFLKSIGYDIQPEVHFCLAGAS